MKVDPGTAEVGNLQKNADCFGEKTTCPFFMVNLMVGQLVVKKPILKCIHVYMGVS